MNCSRLIVLSIMLTMTFASCATGPSVFKGYEGHNTRDQIAIVNLDVPSSPTIIECDGRPVRGARYLLLQPGRHELRFAMIVRTLLVTHGVKGNKYLEAAPGHTYVLQSETFAVDDNWFPEVIDVTGDAELHVKDLPVEDIQRQ